MSWTETRSGSPAVRACNCPQLEVAIRSVIERLLQVDFAQT